MGFQFNKEIWRLGNRAVEMGLSDIFQSNIDSETVINRLDDNDIGKKWLREYRDFLEIHGWRNERMLDWATPNWIEKPSLGIPLIKVAINKGGTLAIEERRLEAAKEREETEREVNAKIAANQRGWFITLMKAAQKAGYWSEDHTYYWTSTAVPWDAG